MRITFSDEELYDVFAYLDELRESSVTNMWGGGEYVERRFSWDDKRASKALITWMKTFSKTQSMDERVEAALALLAHEVP